MKAVMESLAPSESPAGSGLGLGLTDGLGLGPLGLTGSAATTSPFTVAHLGQAMSSASFVATPYPSGKQQALYSDETSVPTSSVTANGGESEVSMARRLPLGAASFTACFLLGPFLFELLMETFSFLILAPSGTWIPTLILSPQPSVPLRASKAASISFAP